MTGPILLVNIRLGDARANQNANLSAIQ